MRFAFGIWTLVVALTVSTVAAYYSIIGLTAIFAAAFVPVVIMGVSLELAKITSAIWLHSFWNEAPLLMRGYLVSATLVLMLITSMGIFGFLSKAHIEQSAGGSQLTATIDRISQDIVREEAVQARADAVIEGFDQRTVDTDTAIQERIATQERLIEGIEQRLEREVAAQNDLINQELALSPLTTELALIEEQVAELTSLSAANDVAALQRLVGARADGVAGPETQRLIEQRRSDLAAQRQALLGQIAAAQGADNPVVNEIRAEIQRLQQTARADIAQAQAAIDAFRSQLVTATSTDNTDDIAEQTAIIEASRERVTALLDERFQLESKLRTLEAEVGPVKYLAEMIYGEADQAVLEAAVRWVIVLLVLVFDPLALVLVLAGISLMKQNKPIDIPPELPHNTDTPEVELDEPDQPPVSQFTPTPPRPVARTQLHVSDVPKSTNITNDN
jgi:hypothetical protein